MNGYFPALNGLRGIAVLAVIGFHAKAPYFGGGFAGVDFFFVLSGFLISSILLAEIDATGSVSLPRFYLRRAQRLMPAMLLAIALYLCAAPWAWPQYDGLHVRDAAVTALFLSDYGKAFWGMPIVLQHTWSLAVEEHFYILWPLLLMAVAPRMPPGGLVKTILCLFALATLWRIACVGLGQDFTEVYYRFDTRASGLVLGALIAAARRAGLMPAPGPKAIAAAAASAALIVALAPWGHAVVLAVLTAMAEIAAAIVICHIVSGAAPGASAVARILELGSLQYLGRISYGLYLFHFPVAVLLRDTYTGLPGFALIAAASAVLASASWYLVERPILAMKPARGYRHTATLAP